MERKDHIVFVVARMGQDEYMSEECGTRAAEALDNMGGCCKSNNRADFWKLPQAQLSFLIRVTFDT